MSKVLEYVKSAFHVGSNVPTGSSKHAQDVAQLPPGERRAPRSGVLYAMDRVIQMLNPEARRASKAERVAQRQEQAAMALLDRQLDGIVDAVLSKKLATAQRTGETATAALVGQRLQAPAIFRVCAERVPARLAQLTFDQLTTLDAGLDQVVVEALKEDALATQDAKPPTSLAVRQMAVSVKSELLRCKLQMMGLSKTTWETRPVTMFVMGRERLLERKDLHDLAKQILEKTDDPAAQTGKPLTADDRAFLKEIQDYGKAAVDELERRATKAVAQADPNTVANLGIDDLKELKQHLDGRVQSPGKNLRSPQEMAALQRAVEEGIRRLENQSVEALLGKGPWDMSKLDAVRLGRLAKDLAAMKDKSEAVTAAEQAILTDIARRTSTAREAFQNSVRTTVRSTATNQFAIALQKHVDQAQEIHQFFSDLGEPLGTQTATAWIREVFDRERALGEFGEQHVQSLQQRLTTGSGKVLWDRHTGDPRFQQFRNLSEAFKPAPSTDRRSHVPSRG